MEKRVWNKGFPFFYEISCKPIHIDFLQQWQYFPDSLQYFWSFISTVKYFFLSYHLRYIWQKSAVCT